MPNLQQMIQVAGARSLDEARMLAACGATHVGLPLRLAYHKPDVSDDEARAIVAGLAGLAHSVLITYLEDATETLALCRFLGVCGVQLHGGMPLAQVRLLRQAAPELLVFKSLIVGAKPEADILAEARAHAPVVDAFLTDTFDPASGAAGATGMAHDWSVSARLARALPRPLILAGGLGPDNVARAIAAVHPDGVDAHTGLEDTRGDKDEALVRRFVAEARRAFASGAGAGLAKDCDSA